MSRSAWGDYVYNGSMGMEDEATSGSSTAQVVIGSLLTIWVIAVNVLVICAILMTSSLRQRCSNWLLLNLAFADLLVGLLVTSFSAYEKGHDLRWELSHHMCVSWLLLDILLSCVSMYMLMAINIDRLVFITYPSQYPRKMRRPVIIFLIVFSWIVSMCIVFPFFFNGSKDGTSIMDSLPMSAMCYIELPPRYSIASSVMAFFVPGACLIAINALAFRATSIKMVEHQRRTAVVSSGNRADSSDSNDDNTSVERLKRVVLVLCVANALYIIMWIPFFFVNILSAAGMYHSLSPTTFDVVIWLAYANSGINPLVWLMYPDIRKAFVKILRCKFDRSRQGFYLDDEIEDEIPVNECA